MKKCLVIAAHPDDDILGCGGLLNRFRKEVDFKVIFIAEGSSQDLMIHFHQNA